MKLKVGDRVKILEGTGYNGCFYEGDIVYVIKRAGEVSEDEDYSCPWYLSKDKDATFTNYYAPYRKNYVLVPSNNIVGGEIL